MNLKIETNGLTEVITGADELFSEIAQVEDALKSSAAEIAQAMSDIKTLRIEQSERDVESALAAPAERVKLEKASASALKKIADAQEGIDRKTSVVEALQEKLRELDSRVAGESAAAKLEMDGIEANLHQQLDEALREAMKPVIDVLVMAQACGFALRRFGIAASLHDVAVPSLRNANVTYVRDGLIRQADGTSAKLHDLGAHAAATAAEGSSLAELTKAARAIAKLAAHRSFDERQRSAVPYKRKSEAIEV